MWHKVKKAAQYAGISERTLRTWLKQGLLHSRMPSGTILISTTAIDAFIRKYQVNENEVEKITNEVLEGF